MLVLGIESSCDETAASVVRDGQTILSNVVASQIAVHRPYGGVVPEIASRHHLKNVVWVVETALKESHTTLEDLDAIAVTVGPGLVGALLVGLQMAKAVAFVTGIRLIGVNHLEGHLCASWIGRDTASENRFPPDRHVALLVSGGHTMLVLVDGFGNYRSLGSTRDDAAGEAFDKVAKLLGLGYPGGPIIEKYARDGDPLAIRFPRALPQRDQLDFSFSGLKTAVATLVRRQGVPKDKIAIADLCASFQQAVADVLVKKTQIALAHTRADALVVAGGVMANQAIRSQMQAAADAMGVQLFIPNIVYCTDNAAMIAAAGTKRLMRGETSPMGLNVEPRLRLV